MLSNSHHYVRPNDETERTYLESLIRADFERCHPGDTPEDLKRRAAFSKEDKGLLRDWMALAAGRSMALRPARDSGKSASSKSKTVTPQAAHQSPLA